MAYILTCEIYKLTKDICDFPIVWILCFEIYLRFGA